MLFQACAKLFGIPEPDLVQQACENDIAGNLCPQVCLSLVCCIIQGDDDAVDFCAVTYADVDCEEYPSCITLLNFDDDDDVLDDDVNSDARPCPSDSRRSCKCLRLRNACSLTDILWHLVQQLLLGA